MQHTSDGHAKRHVRLELGTVLACVLQVIEAGANAIVAGSAVFKAPSYKDGEFPCCTAV